MGNTGADKYEITAREIHENQFSTFLGKLEDDLWKSDSWGLDSERKKVLASSPGALACTLMDLGVFGSVGTHFPSEKLILPYFSSLSMVAILVCDSHRQAGSSSQGARSPLSAPQAPSANQCVPKVVVQIPTVSTKKMFYI